jgi:hypothetical protein
MNLDEHIKPKVKSTIFQILKPAVVECSNDEQNAICACRASLINLPSMAKKILSNNR